jgi:hypothetical protein
LTWPEGGPVQFGKFQGAMLAALGIILIALQVFLHHIAAPDTPSHNGNARVTSVEGTNFPLVGALGGILAISGGAMYFTAQRGDEPHPKNAIK